LAMAVCDAVLTEIGQTGLLGQVRDKAEYLKKKLDDLVRSLPAVREIRQKGLMVGIELDEPAAPFIRQLLENGLVVLPAGEKVLRLLPPLIVSEEEIDQAVSVLHQTLSQTKIGV
jgi:acetylornithine/N-succinyldiaminopimelate aminotransferase